MPLYRQDQKQIAIREGHEATIREWRPHESLKQFLVDYFPEEWERVRECSMRFNFAGNAERPGYTKRKPVRCCRVPFCVPCVKFGNWQRVKEAQDQLMMCTPAGKEPRFFHIVQTAPIYDHGGGWGNQASRNVPGFGRVVWGALGELFGKEGLGAAMSYQDFGERGFAKRHPHMDLTLNGWRVRDGQAQPLSAYDLTGRGRDKWDDTVTQHAQTLMLGAERGNVDIEGPKEGLAAYRGVAKYQFRELVDLRKLEYVRGAPTAYWWSYKEGTRTPIQVDDFVQALDEYQRRLGTWRNKRPRVELHRRFGHMAKRTLNRTAREIGGEPVPHGEQCLCGRCGDWFRVELDDEEIQLNRSKKVPVVD